MRNGLTALVTAGPTRERLDPVRYITNDSSGKQGYAIAAALENAGIAVTLVTGITHITPPECSKIIIVESASEMHAACLNALPVDIAICAAAVADFRPEHPYLQKIKKKPEENRIVLTLIKNPDILYDIANHPQHRPQLVIGFAAETENLTENALRKLQHKHCDWILANDVSSGVFNSDENKVQLISNQGIEPWERMGKREIAERLISRISGYIVAASS